MDAKATETSANGIKSFSIKIAVMRNGWKTVTKR